LFLSSIYKTNKIKLKLDKNEGGYDLTNSAHLYIESKTTINKVTPTNLALMQLT